MNEPTRVLSPRKRLLLLGGGAVAAGVVAALASWSGLSGPACGAAGTTAMTAWCWLTGALPLPVSSLLPALLLPATGAVSARDVAPFYFHDVLLLFLGGFILAIALERYGLHRRFAMGALRMFGTRPPRLLLGFMAVAAALSMFISNTSTALLMMPVALAVLDDFPESDGKKMAPAMLLGIAYACSIGGIGTPIGTAPNAVFIGQFYDRFPDAPVVGFGTWLLGMLPLVVAFIFVAWLVLTRVSFRVTKLIGPSRDHIARRRSLMGKRSPQQNRVLGVFVAVAVLWLTRQGADFGAINIPGWQDLLPAHVSGSISDATVALFGVMLLFILPGDSDETGALLGWRDCIKIPWGVLLLLGGGFALARAFEQTGLSAAIGGSLGEAVETVPMALMVPLLVLSVTFLTEITSNTATINVLLPLLLTASVAAEVHPLVLALPTTIAVSCAFMLPVATPPNAILFSSGRISIPEMARTGIWLNLATVVLVTLFTIYWVAPLWGFDLSVFPDWAR